MWPLFCLSFLFLYLLFVLQLAGHFASEAWHLEWKVSSTLFLHLTFVQVKTSIIQGRIHYLYIIKIHRCESRFIYIYFFWKLMLLRCMQVTSHIYHTSNAGVLLCASWSWRLRSKWTPWHWLCQRYPLFSKPDSRTPGENCGTPQTAQVSDFVMMLHVVSVYFPDSKVLADHGKQKNFKCQEALFKSAWMKCLETELALALLNTCIGHCPQTTYVNWIFSTSMHEDN